MYRVLDPSLEYECQSNALPLAPSRPQWPLARTRTTTHLRICVCSYKPPSSCVQDLRCAPGFIHFAICLAVASKQRTRLIYASRSESVVASDPSLGKHNGELSVQCRAADAAVEMVPLPLAQPAHAPGPVTDTSTRYARPCCSTFVPTMHARMHLAPPTTCPRSHAARACAALYP